MHTESSGVSHHLLRYLTTSTSVFRSSLSGVTIECLAVWRLLVTSGSFVIFVVTELPVEGLANEFCNVITDWFSRRRLLLQFKRPVQTSNLNSLGHHCFLGWWIHKFSFTSNSSQSISSSEGCAFVPHSHQPVAFYCWTSHSKLVVSARWLPRNEDGLG